MGCADTDGDARGQSQEALSGEFDAYGDALGTHAFIEEFANGDPRIRDHSGDDLDDYRFRPTDAVLLVGRTEDELSSLEVHVFAEDTGSLYIHHDITLSAFPLCVEWIGPPNGVPKCGGQAAPRQNFVAVGSFDPSIEVWNLDVLDAFEPSVVLGGLTAAGSGNELRTGSHTDAVLGLSWNTHHPGSLASCSADGCAKLWDLTRAGAPGSCVATFREVHQGKVQSVAWNPKEGDILATAAFDKTIAVIDARIGLRGNAPPPTNVALRFDLGADSECLKWDPYNPAIISCSCEDGTVVAFDVRGANAAPLWQIHAHDESCTSISFARRIPGILCSASVDGTIKLWDVGKQQSKARQALAPVCVAEKNLGLGPIFGSQWYADSPFVIAAGGGKGIVAIWNVQDCLPSALSRALADGWVQS